ncbi:MarR family winged helix-turn-helix transcriptional regulator [Aestuariispira insulae]|uniref:DNA-binding MarR family transcriptional regulator n=1 Tax=Aestuariispira insulae TaxID=1461337 RepID=A0A3D9HGH4_9PROT|nr:MarR family transcriptional regulator [Aestuariispira insulae]RED48096.1 DNA-binding MarR family transcriptional regulator [Aestuariispira insulae]
MENITDCISYLISGAAKQINRRARELLAPYHLTPVQYAVIRALYEYDLQTGSELATTLFMDSATLTGVVDRLEKQGMVARVPDGQDRRINRLALQDKARSLLPELDNAMDRLNAEADMILGGKAKKVRQGLIKLGKGT